MADRSGANVPSSGASANSSPSTNVFGPSSDAPGSGDGPGFALGAVAALQCSVATTCSGKSVVSAGGGSASRSTITCSTSLPTGSMPSGRVVPATAATTALAVSLRLLSASQLKRVGGAGTAPQI